MFFLCLFAPPYLPTSQFLCYWVYNDENYI
jgi:hypothetical protein